MFLLWLRRALSFGMVCFIVARGASLVQLIAAPVPYTWTFPSPTGYTLSDTNLLEVSGNTAKLKVQNYASDANTGMLLHLDESSGDPTDSASTPNTPIATNITYSSGKLNNAAVFNGTTSRITVPDASQISLSGSHTIEAWVNLASPITPNSAYTRSPIFDKGSHQLYFDNETGELVYEVAPSSQNNWSHVAGPVTSDTYGSEAKDANGIGNGTWDYNGKGAVTAVQHIGANLYVGLGTQLADAEVWKWNGTTWSMVGGDGIRSGWVNEKYETVYSMAANGNTLYVGLGSTTLLNDGDAEVWSLDVSSDSNQWVKMGGDGVNSSWNYVASTQGPFEIVNDLEYVAADGALYAAIGSTSASATNSDAEVWRFSGSTWTLVGGDSGQGGYGWTTAGRYENALSLTSDGTNLYVGLGSTAGDAEVWKATLASLAATPSWNIIGGNGTGWAAAQFEEVRALYAHGSYVYAGLGTTNGDAEVYRWNGSTWTKIGECPSTSACTTQGWQNNLYEQIWTITGDGTNIYVGMGNTAGDDDMWQFNDNGTEATADDVWTQIAGNGTANDVGNVHTNVNTLYYDGTYLYAGLQHTSSSYTGELWRYQGTAFNWTRIGGNYINNSWGFYPLATVESMITGNGKMYVGLGSTSSGVHGSALVYEFDGTSWVLIGGQGLNNGWGLGSATSPGPYERVPFMAMYEGKLYVGLGSTAGDGEVWGWGVVSPNTWTKVGGDADTMVAVSSDGSGNRVMSSTNGTSWTIRASATDNNWTSVTHANNLYVAVASSGVGNRVMTSLDGITWSPGSSAADNDWQSVTYGKGLYVAVANTGVGNRVMTSPDGISWTTRTSAADNDWKSVVYGNGMFVAIATSGSNNRVMTSPDGINWTIRTTPADLNWKSVAYGNGVFVAVANDGVLGSVMTSTNGTTWDLQTAAAANAWEAVAFGKDTFVAVSSTGVNNRAMTSTDGVSWTIRATPAGNVNTWSSLSYHQSYNSNLGQFTAVATGGTSGQRSMSSTNAGTTWTMRATPANNLWNSVINPTSWSAAAGQEVVQSMVAYHCPGATNMCLYVGLGSTGSDSRVWAYDGSSWFQVGGNGTIGSWETNGIEIVNSLIVYKEKLYAALGGNAPNSSDGDAEMWEYSGSGTTWTKVGGDGVNSSWDYSGAVAYGPYEAVNMAIVYNGEIYVGLGTTADSSAFADSEVWKWAGSGNWTKVGGDGLNSSWDNSQTMESVRSMAVYNGEMYVGLGDTAAAGIVDSDVYKWNGSIWTLVGGENAINNSWSDTATVLKEQVLSLAVYNGSLYAGLGASVGDAAIWKYGQDAIARTTTVTTQPTGWRHIAATYNQANSSVKVYIDGVEKGSASMTGSAVDNDMPLLIGKDYGRRFDGDRTSYFEGSIDEIRFSNNVRSSFNLTPYTDAPQSIKPNSAYFTSGVKAWTGFDAAETVAGQGILYRLSIDGGSTWKYWNSGSSAWATSTINFATDNEATIIAGMNDKSTINSHISSLAARSGGILWQAALNGDGNQNATLTSVTVSAEPDTDDPTNPTVITALSAASGGTPISTDTWYSHAHPYFSWSGEDDGTGSGVAGYFVSFDLAVSGVCSGDPEVDGMPQASPTYTVGTIVAGNTYCLLIKTYDYAGNVASTLNAFTYKFDNVNNSIPSLNPPSPAGYAPEDNYTFSWVALGTPTGAPLLKLQYKTGAGDVTSTDPRGDAYADWQDLAPSATSVALTDASYQDDENIFYLRTVDVAGNYGTPATKSFYYAGDGASPPQALSVDDSTKDVCSFTFTWAAPETFLGGNASQVSYCYTVNIQPNATLCNGRYTSGGVTSVPNYCHENMRNGLNTFYVVAKNPESQGGTVNYGAYSSVSFTLNTTEPGPPSTIDVSDISVKSQSQWKMTVSWLVPELNGGVVETYQIYRSTDGVDFTKIASTSGTAYVDTGLSQQTYYYKVNACDIVQKCGAFTDVVDLYPTGKFTEPANLVSGPTASDVTTKKATISWGTDRSSDSKVQYGTSSGHYFTEEPSNSTQITAHEITLNNLSPGTTYYYKAKWTDGDGNTGESDEDSFTTEPAPTIKDVAATKVGIDTAYITLTVTGGTRVKLYYGDTAAFGFIKTTSVGTAETTELIELDELEDDTKYYFKVNGVDSDGVEYDGTTLSFTTLPRPKVSDVRVQQIVGTAQPAVLVSWTSNTSISSIVTYYPTTNPSSVLDEVSVELTSGAHQLVLRGLFPDTAYSLVVSGRDKAGNEAQSDKQNFTTATDTRPPRITNLKIESSTTKAASGASEKLAQLIVSWTTDEPATSQVEYGEGAGLSYPQKTQEDSTLNINHLVIITNLPPSRVYHIRALSNDSATNTGKSQDTVTITPKGGDDALDLVTRNLLESFGFLRNVFQPN